MSVLNAIYDSHSVNFRKRIPSVFAELAFFRKWQYLLNKELLTTADAIQRHECMMSRLSVCRGVLLAIT